VKTWWSSPARRPGTESTPPTAEHPCNGRGVSGVLVRWRVVATKGGGTATRHAFPGIGGPCPNRRRVGLTPPEPPTSQCAFVVSDQPAASLDHPPATAALLPFPDRVSNRRGYPFGLGDVVSKQGIGRQDRRQTRLAIPSRKLTPHPAGDEPTSRKQPADDLPLPRPQPKPSPGTLPTGTVRYSRANASIRRAPDRGRSVRSSGGAVISAFGPTLMRNLWLGGRWGRRFGVHARLTSWAWFLGGTTC
jgi:hypothetical protein